LLAACVGCEAAPKDNPRERAALDIYEAFVRHEVGDPKAWGGGAPTFYLSLPEGDPPQELLARLGDLGVPVAVGSQSPHRDGIWGVNAVHVWIAELVWQDDNRAGLRAKTERLWGEGDKCGTPADFAMVRVEGQWEVKR